MHIFAHLVTSFHCLSQQTLLDSDSDESRQKLLELEKGLKMGLEVGQGDTCCRSCCVAGGISAKDSSLEGRAGLPGLAADVSAGKLLLVRREA